MTLIILSSITNLKNNFFICFSSPEDFHHRISQSRTAVENPSVHFQRAEAHNHHVCLNLFILLNKKTKFSLI